MIKYRIVLVPFPFDDLANVKVRPALCLTNPIGNYKHIVIAFISSKITNEILKTDLLIYRKDKSFKETGLAVDSVIRIHKIVTIPINLIKRELGNIPIFMQKQIDDKIKLLFDIK